MSYEPTLIILKKDLDKHRDFLLDGAWQWDGSDEPTRYKRTPVTVGNIELCICTPHFSSFNQQIRERLQDLKVEYGLHN